MNPIRAYIGSLGPAGALVALSLLLFVVVSGLISFDAWPRQRGVEPEALVVTPPKRPPAARPSRAAVAHARRSKPPARPHASAAAPAPAHTITRRAAADWSPRRQAPEPTPATPTPPSPPESPSVDDALLASRRPTLTDRLGDTVYGTTAQLGRTVDDVSPVAGQTLTEAGEEVSYLVRELGAQTRVGAPSEAPGP